VGGARPELVRYYLFFRPMGRASGVGARCWGTPVDFGCLLTDRQLISGCRAVRNLSTTCALFLFHDVRVYDPERRLVRGPPRKCLGMCRRMTNKGESGFGIASGRGTASVEQYYGEPFKTAEGPLHGTVLSPCEDSGSRGPSRGWDPKVPVGSPVSFPKRSNPAWRLVPPPPPCRINTKSKHRAQLRWTAILFYSVHNLHNLNSKGPRREEEEGRRMRRRRSSLIITRTT